MYSSNMVHQFRISKAIFIVEQNFFNSGCNPYYCESCKMQVPCCICLVEPSTSETVSAVPWAGMLSNAVCRLLSNLLRLSCFLLHPKTAGPANDIHSHPSHILEHKTIYENICNAIYTVSLTHPLSWIAFAL